ncbi:hypothetical protein WHR41_09488 [Cladosporium halotolerans]|uniref:Uncharacterized protein n=1 Tax=Cladosporium halotolerans TaxID=1052096 RepID=A0AB34KCX6_9PEZI
MAVIKSNHVDEPPPSYSVHPPGSPETGSLPTSPSAEDECEVDGKIDVDMDRIFRRISKQTGAQSSAA